MANKFKVKNAFEFWLDTVRKQNIPLKETEISTTSDLCDIKTQIVGTTHEVVTAGDVTDTTMMMVYNLHVSATVSIGGDSGGSFVKWFDIAAGDPPAFLPRLGAIATTYLKSSAASTNVAIILVKIS